MLVILLTRNRQRFGDLIARTIVVDMQGEIPDPKRSSETDENAKKNDSKK
jgi:uncharacterized RDD family membrane protein YckC